MKYTVELVVNKPVARVVALFDNPALMSKWQDGLLSFEPLSGTPGQPGAKSKLVYQMGKRKIEMIETITKRNLPDEFSGTYEAAGVFNVVANHFSDQGGNATRWRLDADFRFSGFMKILAFAMPGMFKKQTEKMMNDFKTFAESYEG